MSINTIKELILKFLNSNSNEVIAVYGKWGTGKTYFWKNYVIKNESLNLDVQYKYYSYVSAFGLNSLDKLKEQILINAVLTRNVNSENQNFFKRFKKLTAHAINTLSLAKDGKFKLISSFSNVLKSSYDVLIKNMVICIDDIERTDSNFSLIQQMGYLNYLKELRGCKIVLIGNIQEIDDDNLNEINEKVVDKRISYKISPEEACNIALPKESNTSEILKKHIINLDLSNIRIIQQILTFSNQLETMNLNILEGTWDQILKSLCIFCYCHCISSDGSPTLNELVGYGSELSKIITENRSDPKISFLLKCQFNLFQPVDYLIADLVVNGYANSNQLQKKAGELNVFYQSDENKNCLNSIFDSYYDGLQDNKESVVNDLYEGFKLYVSIMPIGYADKIITILRKLDEKDKSDELIEIYLKKLQKGISNFSSIPFKSVIDTKFKEALEKLSQMPNKSLSLKHVLDALSQNRTFDPSQLQVLNNAKTEDITEYLLNLRNGYLYETINALSVFTNSDGKNEEYRRIGLKVKQSLKIICQNSLLNKIRLEECPIQID